MKSPLPESRRMLFIYLAAGAVFASIGARGLTVPLYAHELGASRFEVGVLFSVSTIAAALLSLPSGVLVDKFGARTLIVISLILTAGSQIAIALTPAVAPLYAWQIIGGLGAGIQQSALFSAVTETVSRSRLGRAMGWLTFSMQVGFFLGPSIAGLALSWIDIRTDIAVTTAMLVAAAPGAIAAGNTRQHAGRGLAFSGPVLALVRQPAFIPVVLGLIGITLSWGTIGAFLPVFGKEALRLPDSQVGYLLALQAVVNGASRIPAGRLIDRLPRRWPIVFVGAIAWSAVMVALGHTTGFVVPAILIAAGTPFTATALVAIGVVFADLATSSTRGVTMGMYGSVLFVGLAAGPLAFGPVMQGYGYAAGFTACAAATVALVAIMAATQTRPLARRSRPAPAGDSETRSPATRQA